MVQLGNDGFNPDDYPTYDGSLFPPGIYRMRILGSALETYRTGKGEYVEVRFEIIEGPHRGRRYYERCMWDHYSDVARKIGRETLARITRAVGIAGVLTDTSQLHGKELIAKISILPPKGDYDAKNTIPKAWPHDADMDAIIAADQEWEAAQAKKKDGPYSSSRAKTQLDEELVAAAEELDEEQRF